MRWVFIDRGNVPPTTSGVLHNERSQLALSFFGIGNPFGFYPTTITNVMI